MDTATPVPLCQNPAHPPAVAPATAVHGAEPTPVRGPRGAPFPPHETARLAALQAQQLLDSLPEQMFDDIVKVASSVCGTPIALISLVDRDRQWFKAKVGLSASETPRDQAFCAHAILEPGRPLVVPDATQDPRFAENPLVTGSPDIRLYAGAPIVSHSGHALGTVCVIDRQPRQLEPAQIEALEALSRQVSNLIEYRRITRNSVDSVQLQLLAKSEKLRDTQVQSERRAQQLQRVVSALQHDLDEPLRAMGDGVQALLDRLGPREPGLRVHAESIAQAASDLKTRVARLQAEITGGAPVSR